MSIKDSFDFNVIDHQYYMFEHFLRELSKLNPDSVIALQADEQKHFVRVFLSLPNVDKLLEHITLKLVSIDGCHSKTDLYDGIIICLMAKTGNGEALLLAIAFVLIENTVIMCGLLSFA